MNDHVEAGVATATPRPDDAGFPSDTVVDRAAQSAHDLVDRVAEKAGPAVDRVYDEARRLSGTQERWLEACRSSIRDRPLTCVGLAAVAGVAFSRLMSR